MANERAQFRGAIVTEDKRTERFIRDLLLRLGFDRYKLTFLPLPSGTGDGGAFVRRMYQKEVKTLRTKNYQRLFLIAIRDGDRFGLMYKKNDLDEALREAGLDPRRNDERIATPVPTWSIETWLLALLGDETVNETASQKEAFQKRYRGKQEGQALSDAAEAWLSRAEQITSVPSLADSRIEMSRLDLPRTTTG